MREKLKTEERGLERLTDKEERKKKL